MAEAIILPKQGNTVEECILTCWSRKVGDAVAVGDVLCDVETDKANFEIESTAAGKLLAQFWAEGDLVPVLETLCVVGQEGEDISAFAPAGAGGRPGAAAAPAQGGGGEAATPAPVAAVPGRQGAETTNAPLSPRARAFMERHPYNLPPIAGSGAGGRIIEADVEKAYREHVRLSATAAKMAAEGIAAPASGSGVGGMVLSADMGRNVAEPAVAAPAVPAGGVTQVKLSNIRKIIAGRLRESLQSQAQYTLNAEIEVTGLLALRQELKAKSDLLGIGKVTINDLVMFATVKALARHPEINAEFDGTTITQYADVNLGFACDTPRGLMVPVIRQANRLSLGQLGEATRALAKDAVAGSLNPDLLTGGTFTISNLGSLGVTTFTPVINAPQVAILGVGGISLRPVRVGDAVEFRDFLQVSLTCDHRVVDGAPGARFLQTLKTVIENFTLVCVAG